MRIGDISCLRRSNVNATVNQVKWFSLFKISLKWMIDELAYCVVHVLSLLLRRRFSFYLKMLLRFDLNISLIKPYNQWDFFLTRFIWSLIWVKAAYFWDHNCETGGRVGTLIFWRRANSSLFAIFLNSNAERCLTAPRRLRLHQFR